MSLYVVLDSEPEPLPYDEASAEFQQHWRAARIAYSDMQLEAGSVAHQLYIDEGPIHRVRVASARYLAERTAEHARQVADELTRCEGVFARTETAQTTTTTKEQP